MLDRSKFIMLTVFGAIIGGCAMVGFVMLMLIIFALTQGQLLPAGVPTIFGIFAFGAGSSIGFLFYATSKFQKEMLKKIGIDK